MNKGSEAMSRILALKESGQMPGIHGTVAELATVDPGYETALSVAAGNKMGAIVVDNKMWPPVASNISRRTVWVG